jgi:gas vesicle protein
MAKYEIEDEPYVVIEQRSSGIGSFLAGLAIGAGIALLLAPRSGAETRRGITRGARRVQRRAEDLVGSVAASVQDTIEGVRERVEDGVDAARNAVELKTRQVSDAVEAGRAAAKKAREDLERRIAETKVAYQSTTAVPPRAPGKDE